MIEFIKAIYDIVVSNNKFLISLEKRIMHIEQAMAAISQAVVTDDKPLSDAAPDEEDNDANA